VQQVGKQKAGRTGPDDGDLGTHGVVSVCVVVGIIVVPDGADKNG
jgi:hypothetical protein